jgi:tRNA (adenine37-N6)-methyltransferase
MRTNRAQNADERECKRRNTEKTGGDLISGSIYMEKPAIIKLIPIGILRTSITKIENAPMDGSCKDAQDGVAQLYPEYAPGLKDLSGFSHVILIFYFDRSRETRLTGKPHFEDKTHGVFATRSPFRPNHVGMSVVRLKYIRGRRLYFSGADMLDETPLVDIKPYISYSDSIPRAKNGWLTRHFRKGRIHSWCV